MVALGKFFSPYPDNDDDRRNVSIILRVRFPNRRAISDQCEQLPTDSLSLSEIDCESHSGFVQFEVAVMV